MVTLFPPGDRSKPVSSRSRFHDQEFRPSILVSDPMRHPEGYLQTRREFLTTGLVAGAALATETPGRASETGDGAAGIPTIDTHTHFYDPRRTLGVPWPSRDDPFLYRPVLPPEYRKLSQPLGVVGTVVVEASSWLEDNQWLLDLAESDPFLVGIVGQLAPGTPGFQKHLERFAANRLFRGIRIGGGNLLQQIETAAFLTDLRQLPRQCADRWTGSPPDLAERSAGAQEAPQGLVQSVGPGGRGLSTRSQVAEHAGLLPSRIRNSIRSVW
jgi:hypothetical protein